MTPGTAELLRRFLMAPKDTEWVLPVDVAIAAIVILQEGRPISHKDVAAAAGVKDTKAIMRGYRRLLPSGWIKRAPGSPLRNPLYVVGDRIPQVERI